MKRSYDSSPLSRVTAEALCLSLLLATVQAAEPGAAREAIPEAVDIEVFSEARPLKAPPELAYPAAEKQEGKEGWVVLNMMIDPKGKPYETTILASSGNAVLEKAALKAVEWMQFEPAKHGRTPVDSSLTFKLVFSTTQAGNGASNKFQTAFKNFLAAVDTGNKEQADAELPNLEVRNLYEDAFKNYAKYLYDRKWGTEAEQLADLRQTVAGEKRERYLPKDVFSRALMGQLSLQVKLKDFGSALETWLIVGCSWSWIGFATIRSSVFQLCCSFSRTARSCRTAS